MMQSRAGAWRDNHASAHALMYKSLDIIIIIIIIILTLDLERQHMHASLLHSARALARQVRNIACTKYRTGNGDYLLRPYPGIDYVSIISMLLP